MPAHILVAVICVSLLSIYIRVLAGLRTRLDRYTCCFLGYLAIDAAHAWTVRTYFADNMLLDYFVPYGLLYGPFLYFAHQVAIGTPLRISRMLFHSLPFFVFLTGYFLWLGMPWLLREHEHLYGLGLSGAISLSLSSYAVWALFFRSERITMNGNDESRMLSAMAMVLAFIAVVLLVSTCSRADSANMRSQWNGFVVSLAMLAASMIVFSHIIRQAVRGTHAKGLDSKPGVLRPDADGSEYAADARYQKSAIPADVLEAYEASLRKLVEDKQVYLDDGLSLASLAQHLKIPKHHLSQVFSLRIGKNFNMYINEQRVNHAIRLMHAYPEMSITDIFFNSGFTAKASFNRYFKQFQGCTPTEYRNGIA